MVSIESKFTSEKEWNLSFLMEILIEAQDLNDDVQVKRIAKRALEEAKKQGNEEWEAKLKAILGEYSSNIEFEGITDEEPKISEVDIAVNLLEVKGIGDSTALKLRSNGFTTIESIASSTPEQLVRVPGVGFSGAQKLIDNAQEYLDNNVNSPSEIIPPESSILASTPYQKLKERTVIKSTSEVKLKNKKTGSGSKLIEWIAKPSETSPKMKRDSCELEEQGHRIEDSRQELLQSESKNKTNRQVPEIEVHMEDINEEYPEGEVSPTIGEEMEEVLSMEDSDQEKPRDNLIIPPKNNCFIEEADFPSLKTPIFPSKKSIVEVEDEQEHSQIHTELLENNTTLTYTVKRSRIPYREQRFKSLPNAEQLLKRQQSAQKILQMIREAGMIEIPMNKPELREIFRAVDLLACKPMRGDNGRCIILLIPIKHVITTNPVYVWDSHVMTGQINSDPTTAQNMAINTHTKKLLQASEHLFSDMITGHSLISLVARYIGILMKANLTFKNHRLYLGSGEIEYQVIIDPVLLSDSRVYCMEKTLPYAYQQGSNLHVVSQDQLEELLEYLEMKYRLLIRYDTSQNAIMKVKDAKLSTFKQLQLFSLPFIAYGVLFSFFLILGLQEIVRFCISLGFGLIFVYGGFFGYLFYRHFQSLKSVGSEFSVPYHQKSKGLSEEDFILINEQVSPEWMAQFSHEVENQNPHHQKPLKSKKSHIDSPNYSFSPLEEENLSQTTPQNPEASVDSSVKRKYQAFLDD